MPSNRLAKKKAKSCFIVENKRKKGKMWRRGKKIEFIVDDQNLKLLLFLLKGIDDYQTHSRTSSTP